MNMIKYISVLLTFSSINCFAQTINVKVEQFGKNVDVVDGVCELKSDIFTLHFNVENMEAFLVGATFDEDVYRSAKGETDLEVPWFESTGMAEEFFNTEKQILISNDAPSYWYFDSINDHRFDRSPVGDLGNWTASRTTEKFFDLARDASVSVRGYHGFLYLCFYTKQNVENAESFVKAALELRFSK